MTKVKHGRLEITNKEHVEGVEYTLLVAEYGAGGNHHGS